MTIAKVRCELISWRRFYSLSRLLARKIYRSGFRPDIIVAVGRGGYMPARVVSDFLHIMNLTSFKIEHYRGTQKKQVATVRYPLSRMVEGESVLLIDDVCDTGDTFETAARHIEERLQPTEIRTAVLHYKKVSSFIPHYYASIMVGWRWLIYPWAVAEDLSEFIKQMKPLPDNTKKIQAKLAADHGVHVPKYVLEDILAMS